MICRSVTRERRLTLVIGDMPRLSGFRGVLQSAVASFSCCLNLILQRRNDRISNEDSYQTVNLCVDADGWENFMLDLVQIHTQRHISRAWSVPIDIYNTYGMSCGYISTL